MLIQNKRKRYAGLAVATFVVAGVILAIEQPWRAPVCGETEGGAPDLCGQDSWINSDGEDLQALAEDDRVVLVDFWTYSCINCIRTLPHLTALYDTYSPYGFTIIGVHSPEFSFEKDKDNVRAAVAKHGIRYPVVQDNDFRVWDNYHNRFWPSHYLIDHAGRVADTQFGEGGYEETEQMVRELLVASGAATSEQLPPLIEPLAPQGEHGSDITPELYAGTGRQPEALGNEEGYHPGEVVTYSADDAPRRDRIYLYGDWYNGVEAMTSRSDGAILLRFHAGSVNFVIDADEACLPVTLDGLPVPAAMAPAGVRRDEQGTCVEVGGADSHDLYAGPVEEHVLRIEVPEGVALYTFAFGAHAQA